MKVVINRKFGGFSISRAAAQFMADRGNARARAELAKGGSWYGFGYAEGFPGGYDRGDPDLIAAVEALGDAANGDAARLRVIEIPDGIEWELDEYDGVESIHERHRSWP